MSDHCVLVARTAAHHDCLRCTRCGEEEAVRLPMEIRALADAADAFAERHQNCGRAPLAIACAALEDVVAQAEHPESWGWVRLRAAAALEAIRHA